MESIVGQKRAVDGLLRSFGSNRRHHAFVFSGPRGVGKFTTARAYADLVLQRTGDQVPHPDLHIIKKEDVVWSSNTQLRNRKQTNIPLDLLRERMIGGKTSDDKTHDASVFKTSVAGGEKVFIIDEAELLDTAGQNALLKTLEEPPLGTTIILVTCREDLLLPTVRSRCHSVSFSPLSEDEMDTWASGRFDDISKNELGFAIDFSSGSPGITTAAINTGLSDLANSISGLLQLDRSFDYTSAVEKIISYVESSVEAALKENPQASKEAANRRAAEMVLMLFGQPARAMVRGDQRDGGIVASGILADVEGQLSTNISIKVLLESLAARWSRLCVGDAVLA